MADQPARALIIYGDSLMGNVRPHHSHLHAVAAGGSCGFLALHGSPTEPHHRFGNGAERVVSELAQLLDIHDIGRREDHNGSGAQNFQPDLIDSGDQSIPSLSDRFMGMKGGMLTNFPPAESFGKQAGFSVLEFDEEKAEDRNQLPTVSKTVSRLLALLGLKEGGGSAQQSNFDMLLLHVSPEQDGQHCSGEVLLGWVDALVGAVQASSQPGTKASSRLYLILVLGYGQVLRSGGNMEADGFPLLSAPDDKLPPWLAQIVPRQSYTMKGGRPVTDVRKHHPLLVAYHLNAVTRRDDVKAFDHSDFLNQGGNLTILVDHFLHEVAFKLWRAPKYGA